jgi:hypothetical protein
MYHDPFLSDTFRYTAQTRVIHGSILLLSYALETDHNCTDEYAILKV